MKKWLKVFLCIVFGCLIGFLNGFMGAGGGIVLVPFLEYVLKYKEKIAHATAILIIFPVSVLSSIFYIINGAFNFSITLPVLIGSLVGGVVGAFLLKKLKNNVISLMFSVVMIGSAIYMFFKA